MALNTPMRAIMVAAARVAMIAAMIAATGAGPVAAGQNHPPVFGYLEKALLMPSRFPIKAKLDTGADNSSIHAQVTAEFERNGKPWIAFDVESVDGRKIGFERQVIRTVRIKRHAGESQRRPVVRLTFCVGDIARDVEVNLVNRAKLKYNLLIGRSFMAGQLLVDSALKFTTEPTCTRGVQ